MKKVQYALAVAASFALPALAFAQNNPNLSPLRKLVMAVGDIVDLLLPIFVGIGVLIFFWGLIKLLTSGEEGDSRKEGWKFMGYGIVIIFAIVSLKGLVFFVAGALDITPGGSLPVPDIIGL